MKAVFTFAIIMLMVPTIAAAQEYTIHGSVEPQGEGIEIIVQCADEYRDEYTDSEGGYEITIPENGICRIRIQHNDMLSDSIKLKIYRPRVRVDLRIINMNNRLYLERN